VEDSEETCDDEDTVNGDGCSSSCSVETNYHCVNDGGGLSTCYECGDGSIGGDENCDHGANDGDGCNVDCMTGANSEDDWSCYDF